MQTLFMSDASESLSGFIARKLGELGQREQSLLSQLSALRAERLRLQNAELAAKAELPIRKRGGGRKGPKDGVIKPNTIMAEVIEILRDHPNGMIALDILAELNKHRIPLLLRTSLSPQLSRLKKSGFIDLQGSSWTLVSHHHPDISSADLFSGGQLSSEKQEAEDANPAKETSTASSSNPEQDGKARLGGGP